MDREPRRVVLVRHAKAESGDESDDHDRRLTSRGEREAAATGRWVAGRVPAVDHAWVSSARRARQTWAAVAAALPEPAEVVVDRALYLASGRDVLERLATYASGVVVVVGHNPTMEQVLVALTDDLHGMRPGSAAVVDLADGTSPHGRLVEIWSPPR